MKDFAKEEVLAILDFADAIKDRPAKGVLQGTLMASCFFEPSTRTRISFEASMKRLGGEVVGFSDGKNTSVAKKETIDDTVKVIGGYVDLMVIRHPLEGAARYASEVAGVPVINAGDGSNQHPTQTLLDLYTIRACQGRLDGIHIAFVGDLKHSRTVQSLVQAASHFNMRMYFISPAGLELPKQTSDQMKRAGILFSFHQGIDEVIHKADIVYMTRIQEERMSADEGSYPSEDYAITLSSLEKAKPSMKILHPLPRVNEIDRRIDATPHAYYFEQAHNGILIRQALLRLLLGK